VYLIGFSGSGKSTLGPRLALKLKATFLDTDAIIERRAGRSIAEIFAQNGQAAFRTIEHDVLTSVTKLPGRKVIALGGGAFAGRANRSMITSSGLVVYLSCPVRELHRRLVNMSDRPLLEGHCLAGETKRQARLRRITTLLARRQAQYRQAHIRLSTAGKTVAEATEQLYRKVKERHGRRPR